MNSTDILAKLFGHQLTELSTCPNVCTLEVDICFRRSRPWQLIMKIWESNTTCRPQDIYEGVPCVPFILRPKGVNLLLLWIFTAELSGTEFKETQILKWEWEPRSKVKFFSWHRVSLSRLESKKGPCATSTLEKNKIGSKTDPKRALFSVSPRVYIYFPTSTSHSLSSVRLNYSCNILQTKDRKSVIA